VTTLYAVLQFMHDGSHVDMPGDPVDLHSEPTAVTNGFRVIFRRVFTDVRRVVHQEPIGVEWLGMWMHLGETLILHSAPLVSQDSRGQRGQCHRGASRLLRRVREEKLVGALGGLEPDTYVFVMTLEHEGEESEIRAAIEAQMRRLAWSESAMLKELRPMLDATPCGRLMDSLRYRKPDVKLPLAPFPPASLARVLPFILGFYGFGQLTVHRIDRDQAQFLVPSSPHRIGDRVVQGLAALRSRITNVKRYFLTTNRTNNRELRAYCAALVNEHGLAERAQRQTDLIEDLERQFENVVQLGQMRYTRRVNLGLMILGGLGLPAAWLGALLAFGFTDEIVARPQSLVVSKRFWALTIGLALVLMVMTLVGYSLGKLWDRNPVPRDDTA
jgi:hypothetical protein